MSYGVQPTGFVRKPLAEILADIEKSLITEFGPDVIQTPQSPLGQINGLMADIIAELWELGEAVYQAYDIDQAEGQQLDTLARLRLIQRGEGETDSLFRQAITNQSTARVDLADLSRAIRGIEGTTYSQVFVNEGQDVDEHGIPRNSISVAVLGGDDGEIANAVSFYAIPGISTHGNVPINAIDDEGFCRTVYVVRPDVINTTIEISVRAYQDRFGCPAPSPLAISQEVLQFLQDRDTRPRNGQDINNYFIRQFLESRFPNVEFRGMRVEREDGISGGDEGEYQFFEIANVTAVEVVQ